MMNNTSKILRNTAAAVFVAVASANLYLVGTSVYSTVTTLTSGMLSGRLNTISFMSVLKAILDPLLLNLFNLVL